MSAPRFPAFRFDGRHADALPVALRVENAYLIVETAAGTELERERLDRAVVSEPLDALPAAWIPVPESHVVIVRRGEDELLPFTPRRH